MPKKYCKTSKIVTIVRIEPVLTFSTLISSLNSSKATAMAAITDIACESTALNKESIKKPSLFYNQP
jgi:hypothetical protein